MVAKRKLLLSISDEEEARIQAGIARDPDNPELTDAELAAMRPAREVLPAALFAALAKRRPGQRGPGRKPALVAVTLRVEPSTLEAYRAAGDGWQGRMREVLKAGLSKRG